MTPKSYDDHLEAGLLACLSNDHPAPLPQAQQTCDRWLSASALHKAIRRGQIDLALPAAANLIHHDPHYFWRRLVIIVLEEIGIADPDLCGQVLFVSGKAAWRERNGGPEQVAKHLIARMCAAPKDRNAAEIPQAAVLMDSSLTWAEHGIYRTVLDLWRKACGFIDAEMTFTIPASLRPIFQEGLVSMDAPENIRLLFDLASRKTRECLSIGIVGAYMLSAGKKTSTATEVMPGQQMIGQYPAATYDKHTRLGKQAIARFAASTIFDPFLAGMIDRSRAVGLAIFDCESQRVANRLVYDRYDEPMTLSTNGWLCSIGMDAKHVPVFLDVIGSNLPELNKHRACVLNQVTL